MLEDFRKLYPNDPCIDLLSIDYYTLKKDFPKASSASTGWIRQLEATPI